MANKPRPNEACSCGSGKKFKKCCGSPGATTQVGSTTIHTPADRQSVLDKLSAFVDDHWGEREDEAFDYFWGGVAEYEESSSWVSCRSVASCALD